MAGKTDLYCPAWCIPVSPGSANTGVYIGYLIWRLQAQLLWLPVISKFQTVCTSFLFSTPFGTNFPLKKAPELITDTSRTRISFTIFGITQFHSHTSTQRLTGQWHRTELIAIRKPAVQTALVKLFQFKVSC